MGAWFGVLSESYLSDINSELFDAGDTTECRLGMIFSLGKFLLLYCYVILCHACIILVVVNNISSIGRKRSPGSGEFLMYL